MKVLFKSLHSQPLSKQCYSMFIEKYIDFLAVSQNWPYKSYVGVLLTLDINCIAWW